MLFAKKIGMSRFLDRNGKFVACTLFQPVIKKTSSAKKANRGGKKIAEMKLNVLENFMKNYEYYDVQGVSTGKGFAGAMKRHNFSGLRATHGVSASHRSHGSTGQCQDPGRVFKGKKMAGHMGCKNVTVQNLRYLSDFDGLLIFSGCVPGNEKSVVRISPAVKKYGKVSFDIPGNANNDSASEDVANGVVDAAADASSGDAVGSMKAESVHSDNSGAK